MSDYRLISLHIIMIEMKRQTARRNSFGPHHSRPSLPPQQFRDVARNHQTASGLNKTISKEWPNADDRSSDSESSEGCFGKKFYRCGCLSGCQHHRHRDYLAEMRQSRLQRRMRASSLSIQSSVSSEEAEKLPMDSLLLSETEGQGQGKHEEGTAVWTPQKARLARIAQISESAECSERKTTSSIIITLGGRKYFKTFTNTEEVRGCFRLIEDLLAK